MPTKHLLSSCCGAKIYHHGSRRQQCSKCKKTWTKHKHKRGRNPQRINKALIKRIVLDKQRIKDQIQHFPFLTVSGIKKRFEKSLHFSVSLPRVYPEIDSQYILITDGMWFKLNGETWILYVFLLKPINCNYAYLLDPTIIKGKESFKRWEQAIDTIPKYIREHIFAFVSDDFSASCKITRHYGWIHQLCHAHLIRELHRRRGKIRVLETTTIRECIYLIIRRLIVTKDKLVSESLMQILKNIYQNPKCPYKMRMIINTTIRKISCYHAFLDNPTATIPNTSNVAESLIKTLRDRIGKFSNPEAIQNWATAYMRLKKKMNCNATKVKNFPQN